MEEAQRTQASRRGHRAHLTKLLKKTDDIMTKESSSEMDMATLQSTTEQLEKKKAILKELDAKIITLIEQPDELEQEIIDSEDIQSNIIEKICQVRKFFDLKQAIPPQQPTASSPSTSSSSVTSPQEENQQQIFAPSNVKPQQVLAPPNVQPQQVLAPPNVQPQVFSPPNVQPQQVFSSPNVQPQQVFSSPNVQPQQVFSSPNVQPQQVFSSPNVQPQQVFSPPNVQPQQVFSSPNVQPQQVFSPPNVQPQQVFSPPNVQSQQMFPSQNVQPQQMFLSQNVQPQQVFPSHNVQPQQVFPPPDVPPQQVFPQTLPSQEISTQSSTPQVSLQPATVQSTPSFSTHTTQNTSRLPKLSLPTFNGNPLQWQTFWGSFNAAVHSNSNLSGVEKFNYLRAQTSGEAAKAISGFPLTNTNYEQAIALLNERFGHSYKIVNATHVQSTSQHGLHRIIDLSKHTNLSKLIRCTAYIFVNYITKKNPPQFGPLSTRENEEAERKWIQNCQALTYDEEIVNLQSKNASRLPLVRQLRLFIDKNGHLRCGGRIHNAPVNESTKFPYLLPSKHPFTGKNEQSVRVGDVVLIHSEKARLLWHMAVIESLIRGKDGLVRTVNLRTSNGRTNRPITKLYPLELVEASETSDNASASAFKETKKAESEIRRGPVREAAKKATRQLKKWTSALRGPEDVEN